MIKTDRLPEFESGIRIIYAFFAQEGRVQFIEIYYKGDKEMEDRARIARHYKT